MPGWYDLLQQLNSIYDPSLPASAPKPPGYWAAEKLRSGNPLEIASILPGILGSGLQAYTENVPERIVRGLLGDEGFESLPPLGRFAATTVADPLLPFSFGPRFGARIAGPAGAAIARGVNYPFEKIGEGLTAGVKAAGRGIEYINPSLLREHPESRANVQAQALENIVGQGPVALQQYQVPLGKVSTRVLPLGRNGLPDIEAARGAIGRRYGDIEAHLTNITDPTTALYNSKMMQAAQVARANIMEGLTGIDQHIRRGGQVDELGRPAPVINEEALAAYHGWWARMHQLLDSIESLSQKGPTAGTVSWDRVVGPGTTPTETLGGLWQTALKGAKALVDNTQAKVNAARAANEPNVETIVRDLYVARNVEISRLWGDLANDIVSQFGVPPEVVDQVRGIAGNDFRQMLQSMEIQAHGGTTGMGGLPTRLQESLNLMGPLWFPEIEKVTAARGALARGLAAAIGMDPGPGATLDNIWEALQSKLQAANLPPLHELGTATSTELSRALGALTSAGALPDVGAVSTVNNLLSKWADRGDLLRGNPLMMAVTPAKARYQAILEGPRPPRSELRRAVDSGLGLTKSFLKEGWLANTGYLLTNLLSGLGMNAFFGGPEAAAKATQYAGEMFRKYSYGLRNPAQYTSLDYMPIEVSDVFRRRGFQQVDVEFSAPTLVNANVQALGDLKTAHEKLGWKGRLIAYGLMSPLDPVGGPLTALFGALGTKHIVRGMRNIAGVEEGAMRLALGVPEWTRALNERFPQFIEDTTSYLLDARRFRPTVGGVPGAEVLVKPISPAPGADIRQWLQARGPEFSPAEFGQMLTDAGVHIDDAKVLQQKWATVLDETKQKGIELAAKVHINYAKFNNLEKMVDDKIPFSRWPIRMLPNFRDIFMQNPAVVIGISRLNNITREDAEELGLPARFQRMVDTGSLGTFIMTKIMAQAEGTKLFVDPSRVALPWESYLGGIKQANFAEGPIEAARQMLPGQLYPQYGVPLQLASGMLGATFPQLKPVLPWGPESSLPNINRFSSVLGYPAMGTFAPQELWQGVANMVPGVTPYSNTEAATQRRLGELSALETGYVNHPQYVAARNLRGPIYDRAAQQTNMERAREQVYGLMFPAGFQSVSPEELAVRAAGRNLPRGQRDTPEKIKEFQKALEANPWAGAHLGAQGTDLRTRAQYAFNVMQNPAALFPDAHPDVALRLAQDLIDYEGRPTTASQKSAKIANPLIGAALARKHQFLQTYPEAKAYLYWRQQLHPTQRALDEPSLMDQFIEWFLAGGKAPARWEP